MSQPNPFTANVNRAKTKKWVEAKSYSYDGDDWGEVDDYDEYGGYDEPEPAQKATGLRQRGQSASQMPREAHEARQDLYQSPVDSRQPYEIPEGPPPQQQYGGGNFTNTHPQQKSAIVRTSSFERDDERRAFSAGGPQQSSNDRAPEKYIAPSLQKQDLSVYNFQPGPSPNYPVQPQPGPARPPLDVPRRPDMEAQPRYGEQIQSAGGNYGGGSYFDEARPPVSGNRTQSMTSNNSGLDLYNRRDFSPSAMPPPLQTRGSPSPHSPDSRSSSRHPPRKSSRGQDNATVVPFPAQPPPMPGAIVLEDDDFPSRDRASSGAAKPLPFVRPADIYKRMQEERERERQSQDSSRSSIEAIPNRPNERPAVGKVQDSESSPQLKPASEPITGRTSEYGLENSNSEDQEPFERRSATSKTFNFPRRAANTSSPAPQSSLHPMLPNVSRVSGFGESFFGSSDNTGEGYQRSLSNLGDSSISQPSHDHTQPSTETGLQHQPSLGFTSAVHQAFEKAEDQVPPTPNSTQGSSVARSISGGTSTVSPIISRGPSTATESWNARLPGIDNVSTPTIPERSEVHSSRPLSSDSMKTRTEAARKPAPLQNIPQQEAEERPASFIPGYRRNSDTPSPDNSPRRTPALELNRSLRQPQEVELAAATPTDPSFSADSSSLASETTSEQELSGEQLTAIEYQDLPGQNVNIRAPRESYISSLDRTGSPISPAHDQLQGRTNSSSSSRVRNLADKFESVSRPGSAHSTTPRASMFGPNAQKKDDLVPPRPLVDHRESFRPHLPGGWESSIAITPAATFRTPQAPVDRQDIGQNKPLSGIAPTSSTSGNGPSGSMAPRTADQHTSSVTQIKDASEEAFAAVTAAGSALVDAFGAAVGMGHHDSSPELTPNAQSEEQSSHKRPVDSRVPTHDGEELHPETSRPHLPPLSDVEGPTAAPTLLAKDIPQEVAEPSETPDSLRASSPEHDTDSNPYPADQPQKLQPTLPLLNTDTASEQYESDRLRKEIVRELTPMSASQPTTAETNYSNYHKSPSVAPPGHESGVLPKEYESYWNDADSDEDLDGIQRKPPQVEDVDTTERSEDVVVRPLQLNQGHDPIQPTSGPQKDLVQGRPQMLPHLFSWEGPMQDLPAAARPAQEQTASPTSNFLRSAVYPDNHPIQPQEGPTEAYTSPKLRTVTDSATDESSRVPEEELPVPEVRNTEDRYDGVMDVEKELPSQPSTLEVAPLTPAKQPDGLLTTSHVDDMSNMISRDPVSLSHRGLEPEPSTYIGPSPPVQTVDLPPLPPSVNAQPKFPAFREILALKNPSDRIRAYNETQDQFANMNTGLAHWLAATANDLPEHADLLTSSGQPTVNLQGHRPAQSRSKLGGLLPGGGQPGQPPYSKQYFNASPGQQLRPDGIASGNGMAGGSPQGVSPVGGQSSRMSSQQVQAKGKDLLHTAGVFGGKANVAAKGLFSKGKSKFRAASGNEKATSRQSPGPERYQKMQKQSPIVQSQSPTKAPADLRTNTNTAVAQTPLPEAQYLSQSPPHQSFQDTPSDTPSIESFTQGQLGDDERSEESEPVEHKHLPRTSSLQLQHGLADPDSRPLVQDPVIIGDNAPVFLHETLSADSYVESPKEIHSPQSTTSSNNRTPTQASFANKIPSSTPHATWQDDGEKVLPRQETREDSSICVGEALQSGQLSGPHARVSTEAPYSLDSRAAIITNRDVMQANKPRKQSSGDTKSTIRSVRDEGDFGGPLVVPSKPTAVPKNEFDLISRAPARMSALAASEVSPTDRFSQKRSARPLRSRPVSTSRDSLGVPGVSQDYLIRDSSIHGMPVPVGPIGPPSPIVPYRPTPQEALEQRGRTGPIHYGLDHDFVPDRDHERARSRSRSYSRTSTTKRPSQDSRRLRKPSTGYDSTDRASGDIPSHSYSGELPREKSPTLRQQAPQYEIKGVPTPIEWPTESSPKSRRRSRGSAFFRSLTLGSSSRLDEPPLPKAPDTQPTASPAVLPGTGERKGRRASILRSLTGNSGSGSASSQSKVKTTPIPSVPQHEKPAQVSPAIAPQLGDDEFPSRGNLRSASSKLSKRLQRSSTSGNTEQATSKKNRFSGIGSLFGRGNPKRQSSLANPRTPSQRQPSAQIQQADPYAMTSPPPTSQQSSHLGLEEGYTPPPPGGYYAPKSTLAHNTHLPSKPRRPRNGQSSSWVEDAPAYVQDATFRQRVDQRMSPPMPNPAPPRSSATFPQATPQHPPASMNRASTTWSKSREPPSERQAHKSKPSGSSWTRISQHRRSKSRQDQQRPSSNTSQQPAPYSAPHASRSLQTAQQPYQDPFRSDSPPPPPPPPKDVWHQSRSSQHGPSPSTSSTRPLSSQNRQSLPPLQTNVPKKERQSAIASGKNLTPEEKRKSRQLEIERSTIDPYYREEEPPVVMSATSFPGQMWQPEYAHWDGD